MCASSATNYQETGTATSYEHGPKGAFGYVIRPALRRFAGQAKPTPSRRGRLD